MARKYTEHAKQDAGMLRHAVVGIRACLATLTPWRPWVRPKSGLAPLHLCIIMPLGVDPQVAQRRGAQVGAAVDEERARALTTRAAVMQLIANTTTRHISEQHRRSTGVDRLQGQLASEMDSTGTTLFMDELRTNTFQ